MVAQNPLGAVESEHLVNDANCFGKSQVLNARKRIIILHVILFNLIYRVHSQKCWCLDVTPENKNINWFDLLLQ